VKTKPIQIVLQPGMDIEHPGLAITLVRKQLGWHRASPSKPLTVPAVKLHMTREQLRAANTPLQGGCYQVLAVVGQAKAPTINIPCGRYAGTIVDGTVVAAVLGAIAYVWVWQPQILVKGPGMLTHDAKLVAPWLRKPTHVAGGPATRGRRRKEA
jgi:hypothetical protein